MMFRRFFVLLLLVFSLGNVMVSAHAQASTTTGQNINLSIQTTDAAGEAGNLASPVKIVLLLTILSVAPAILIALTSFTRIIIVLSLLRHAFGLQQTPPNIVLVNIALLLTIFVMAPTFEKVNEVAFEPYQNQQLSDKEALAKGMEPIREFMLKQTKPDNISTIYSLAKKPIPSSNAEVKTIYLISAFMLNELEVAFKIGFVLFLPFLVIDFICASTLMALGMIMVPPTTISLPIKILVFVLINGWGLVISALVGSFY